MPLSTDLETGKRVADLLVATGATYEHPGYVAVPLGDGTYLATGQHNWFDVDLCESDGAHIRTIKIPEPRTVVQAVVALADLRERLIRG